VVRGRIPTAAPFLIGLGAARKRLHAAPTQLSGRFSGARRLLAYFNARAIPQFGKDGDPGDRYAFTPRRASFEDDSVNCHAV
jgi:hypothetical protein